VLRHLRLYILLALVAAPVAAHAQVCSAEYSGDQCEQMHRDGVNPDGTSGGGGYQCPYYLCGNATGNVQSSVAWCEATQNYKDCPIAYCTYQQCVGTNCTPETITCSSCPSRQGNNVHLSECPRK
jgi:hypothetical protein